MERYEDLPSRIQEHLRAITESSGLPPGDESLRRITQNWLEKRRMFTEQIRLLDMFELDGLQPSDSRGAIALTYSGSLISLGLGGEGGRSLEYASIKLRSDVPRLVKEVGVELAGPIVRDKPAAFTNSSIEKTSDILSIASCDSALSRDEQERRLREATIFLTNGFTKLNRTLTMPGESEQLDHFTTKTLVAYVARKNDLTQAQARQVIDDYLAMVEAGMVLGERVPVGRLGRVHLDRRPPQKARMGRNPATGEELLIPAKPATLVPKFSFSKPLRERAEQLPVAQDDEPNDEPEHVPD